MVFRRQLCTKPLFLPADKGNKVKHTQGFAQIRCPGRAGVEDTKAEQREARPPPTRSPVGCWGAQPPLAAQQESVQLHLSLHTKPFVHPPPDWPHPDRHSTVLWKASSFSGLSAGAKMMAAAQEPYKTQMPPSHMWKSTGWAERAAAPHREGRKPR